MESPLKKLSWMMVVAALLVSQQRATSAENSSTAVNSSANASDNPQFDFLLNSSALVVVGEVEDSPKEVERQSPNEHLWYYCYPVRVVEVLQAKSPPEETIQIAIVWSGQKGDASFLKIGDKRLLFLQKPTERRPAWLVLNRDYAILPAEPQLVASWKKLISDGPPPPFKPLGSSSRSQRTTLDIRFSTVTNVIAAVPKRLINGHADVLELPIRIENHSTQTITASLAHEWYGGIWPGTDLGATVRKIDEPAGWWRQNAAYLSGELGIETEPTIWEPGQSHKFVLRMNWPGTGSVHGGLLIDANATGKYAVRFSLSFKTGDTSEYVASQPMEIEVREKSTNEVKPKNPSDWGEPVDGVSVRLQPEKTVWTTNETPTLKVQVRNQGERRSGTTTTDQRAGRLEVDGIWYGYDSLYLSGLPETPL